MGLLAETIASREGVVDETVEDWTTRAAASLLFASANPGVISDTEDAIALIDDLVNAMPLPLIFEAAKYATGAAEQARED